ncbi:MAG TPA: antibiotic biosynthesis monooxygenase [Jatrophihabitans sp.]|nr:antibiotic biosynthesis monooxygenase [Jatrophihabitans sp.]
MIVTIQLRQQGERPAFQQQAEAALRVLAVRPGYLRGAVARATDDPQAWLLLTEWESVGAYRRALGGYEVKLTATPLMAAALDQPSAFEELLVLEADGAERRSESDRARDADWVDRRD